MITIKHCKGLQEVYANYDYFIIDIWGVVYDGYDAFPGVIDCLRNLKAHNKSVGFLSNSPRLGAVQKEIFTRLGIPKDCYDFIYCSGDAVVEVVESGEHFSPNADFIYIGDEAKNGPLDQELPGNATDNYAAAQYVLCASVVDGYQEKMAMALTYNLPMVCSNPDMKVMKKDEVIVCPGSIAKEYEEKGGQVIYIGKPKKYVYDKMFEKHGTKDRNKVLAIGDGLFTDIKGANDYGIDTVLINSGLHHSDLSTKSIEDMLQQNRIYPTYITDAFKW